MKTVAATCRQKVGQASRLSILEKKTGETPVLLSRRRSETAATGGKQPRLRNVAAELRKLLPEGIERDTSLMPEWIAESVCLEVSRYLKAELPEDFSTRLAAKARHLYPRHKHFQQVLRRGGNRGRDMLYVYMRHWTAAWLKKERRQLYKRLPEEFANGKRLAA